MTNGEKIQQLFPYAIVDIGELAIYVWLDSKNGIATEFTDEWWNAEYKEPTTKNDLGVDCIDRAKAQTEIEMNAFRYTLAKERGGMGQVEWSDQLIKVSDAVGIIRDLPSVTPQEPILDVLRAEITTLQNRCYALTKGTMCAFCRYECEYKTESEDT